MRIGLRVPPCAPVPELVAFAREVERAGLDRVWFPDSQLLWRDVFGVCCAVAAATERIGVGTAVTNVVTRHPSVVASAARTVAELAPDRFVLGLGVGNSAVAPAGLAPSRTGAMRAGVRTLRALLAGADVDLGGRPARLRDPMPVPLHLAASGPGNLRLAGEVADGAILLGGVAPTPLDAAIVRVRRGAEAAGRPTVPVTASAFCILTDDLPRAARVLKPICAGVAANGGTVALRAAGIDVRVPDRIEGVHPDLVHAEDWDAAVAACDPFVPDRAAVAFARRFCLVGTGEQVADRIRGLAAHGVDAVLLQHVGSYDLPQALLDGLATRVLPRLGVG